MDLRISLIQAELYWESAEKNRAAFEPLLADLEGETDLIALPEMFTTGFTMNAATLAEPMEGETHQWMQKWAAKTEAAVLGSLIIEEEGKYFNRLFCVFPNGKTEHYDKRHLFRMAKEDETFSSGQTRKIIHYKGWKILPQICYDVRFPAWSRNHAEAGEMDYDCVIYIANFPERRVSAWSNLLRARAIENLAYCVGVNRTGTDGKGIYYSGDSAVIDFLGNVLWEARHLPQTATVKLSYEALKKYREKFPAYLDADAFSL